LKTTKNEAGVTKLGVRKEFRSRQNVFYYLRGKEFNQKRPQQKVTISFQMFAKNVLSKVDTKILLKSLVS